MLTGQINHYGGNVVDPTARELLSEIQSQVQDLQDNAVILNGFFDDTLGWWSQVQGEDKRDDSVIVHGREITHNTGNREVSPMMVTQTKVNYSSNTGELFTRITDSYHELIGEGEITAERDSSTPNFTATGATAYNKFKGNVGVCASTYRVYDKGYTDEELSGRGASKSCGGNYMTYRHGAYRQGKNGGSYSIGGEFYIFNDPTYPDETDFYGNDPHFRHKTWTAGIHIGAGGTYPVTAGILINGFNASAYPRYTSGTYNGIVIGATSMKINGANSAETVGINMGSWKKSGFYGYTAVNIGYVPRALKSRGSAFFEAPSMKFLNPDGDMPVAVSSRNTPYIDFKTGIANDYYENSLPKERPTDTTHARIGYVSSSDTVNFSCTGGLKFTANRQFTTVSDTSVEGETGTVQGNDTANTIDYIMKGTDFSPSAPVNLGTSSKKWDNIYANTGTINTSDRNCKTDISDIDEKILRAWSKVNYKIFKFKGGTRLHIGLIAQDIDDAFKSEGLNAREFGLFCEDVDENGNKILGVRYSECLALECAYLRNRLGA